MSYFPESYDHRKNTRKFELNLSNYITKSNLKRAAGIDTSKFAKNIDLVTIKWNVERLDIDKLEIKLSNVVKKNVLRKG